MAIEAQTPAVQLTLTGTARIAAAALQRFANREDAITAEQAAPIDAALVALAAALQAAGVSGLASTQTIVSSTVKRPVGTVSGTGTFGTFTVVAGVITGIVLSAS